MNSVYKKEVPTFYDNNVEKKMGENNKFYYVYKILFSNGNYYIGKHTTKNFDDGYCGSGTLLHREFLRENKGANKIILGFYDNNEEVDNAEDFFLGDKYKTDEKCLNFIRGGMGGFSEEMIKNAVSIRKGKKLPKETTLKMSAAHKGKKHSDKTKEKISKWHKEMFLTDKGTEKKQKIANVQHNRKKSEEEIKKISVSHKRIMEEKGKSYWSEQGFEKMKKALRESSEKRVYTEEMLEKLKKASREWHATHKMILSEEAKRKIGDALRGKKKTEEHKEKLRLSRIGKKATLETRKKMSEKTKGQNNPKYVSGKIEMYDIEGNLLQTFNDGIEACAFIKENVNKKAISHEIFFACKTGRIRYGYKWKKID